MIKSTIFNFTADFFYEFRLVIEWNTHANDSTVYNREKTSLSDLLSYQVKSACKLVQCSRARQADYIEVIYNTLSTR